jgi:phosphatidate cytidylyltransferase
MFRTRLISGIVLVAIALATIISGGPVLAVTLLLVSLAGVYELYRVFHVEDGGVPVLALCGYAAVICYYALLFWQQQAYTMMGLTGFLILLMAVYVFTYPRYRADQVTGAFFSVVYVAVMLSCIYQIRIMEDGVYLVWLVFFASWGCDTCAYCVGKLFGRHKMSPKLSPKKSVEGAIGGVAGAALLGAIYGAAIGGHLSGGSYVLEFAQICAVGGLISMVGDLAASAIKRNYDIKDYGTLIPGHGGIMDRFDSVIFIAPVIFFLAQYLL